MPALTQGIAAHLAAHAPRQQPLSMPTALQFRLARLLLGWSQADLAARAGVGIRTIARCERGAGVPRGNISTLERIVHALEAGGVEFLRENTAGGIGVRMRRRP